MKYSQYDFEEKKVKIDKAPNLREKLRLIWCWGRQGMPFSIFYALIEWLIKLERKRGIK